MTERPIPTKREFIWKIGVLRGGCLMFLFFAIADPLILLFTTGKPLTLGSFVGNVVISAIVSFFAGLAFGWVMWRQTEWKRQR